MYQNIFSDIFYVPYTYVDPNKINVSIVCNGGRVLVDWVCSAPTEICRETQRAMEQRTSSPS